MKLGIVGLPNVGKSTLFNALTLNKALAANYPFCTIDPNVGIVAVKDERIDALAKISNSKKVSYSTIKFVDIAGLVKGASKGEGLGNKFLSHIREVDAIVHIVRCFKDQNITHVSNTLNPVDDIKTINLELIFADMDTLTRRIEKTVITSKSGDKKLLWEVEVLKKVFSFLEQEIPVRAISLSEEEKRFIDSLQLLTSKPIIYCANVSELGDEDLVREVRHYANQEKSELISICVSLEEELSNLNPEEKEVFLQEFGIAESGLNALVRQCYTLLNLISFLTTGESESRAWKIKKGTKAPQAAGVIHTDFERGFIKAEVIDYASLIECGSMSIAKAKGLLRIEGKDYVMKDGDVVEFRFNV